MDMAASADDSTAGTNEDVQESFEAKPFGRVPTQIRGGLFLYIAALYPLTVLTGWLISSLVGGAGWIGGQLGGLFLFFFGPLMGLSLLLGIIVHGIGTVIWLVEHAFRRPASDLLTILRSIPPTVLSVVSAVFLLFFLPRISFASDGASLDFFTTVLTYLSVYFVIAVAGIVFEIVARRRRPASTVDSPVVSSGPSQDER